MYKKILLALDLIQFDDSPVLQRGEELATFYKAEIFLVHVVEQFYNYGPPPYPFNITELQNELVSAANEKLQRLAQVLQVPDEKIFTPIGNAKEHILEIASDVKADLIILGSHSRKGIGYYLLGSTANGVLQNAKCDVLAVRVSV